ncbi:MAG: helix-turn-helix domain-containing protein [Thiohalomonadales bacterium]
MDNILPVSMTSPQEVLHDLSGRFRRYRLDHLNWSRRHLANRSGVAESTIKRFEKTGQITIENLVRLAFVMNAIEPLFALFDLPPVKSIAELERQTQRRQRGRISS